MAEVENSNTIVTLPMEIILKIILELDKIDDIKSCLLVSKELRHMILKTPQIMNKFMFNLDVYSWNFENSHRFLENYGKFIKNLSLEVSGNAEILRIILTSTCNLEYLELVGSSINCQNRPLNGQRVDMSSLKVLKVANFDFTLLTFCTTNLNNLETFKIDWPANKHPDVQLLVSFICEQDKLKNLKLDISSMICFPLGDITPRIKFQLEKFSLICRFQNSKSFRIFLESQIGNLRKLRLSEPKDRETFEIIFEKGKKLERLSFWSCGYPLMLSYTSFPNKRLKTVKRFADSRIDGDTMSMIRTMMPNVEVLKCNGMFRMEGGYRRIKEIEIGSFHAKEMVGCSLPGLKSLKIWNMPKEYEGRFWMRFIKNIPNVENIVIHDIEDEKEIEEIVRSVKKLEKLKTFKMRSYKYKDGKYDMDEDEKVPRNHKFYKILIDCQAKVIKVSDFMANKWGGIEKYLGDHFVGYEFVRFCYHAE